MSGKGGVVGMMPSAEISDVFCLFGGEVVHCTGDTELKAKKKWNKFSTINWKYQ